MKTRNILKALTGSLLAIAATAVSAGHEAPYRYDEASDTIVFSRHDGSSAAHVQLASAGPVSLAERSASAQVTDDWFLDQ